MELEDEAEALMAPRPCPKKFSSLAERQAYHDDLVKAGRGANAGGRFDVALARFTTAYPVLFKSSVLLSLVNMRLKLGEADLAVACYERLLSDAFELTAAERRVATVKLAEARSLVKSVTAICEPDQAKILLNAEKRAAKHDALVAKAHAANKDGDAAAAESLFLQAHALQRSFGTLLSAANMMLKAATAAAAAPGPSKAAAKLALAAAVYNRMDRMASDGPLRTDGPMASDAERGVLLRKKSQARAALIDGARTQVAVLLVQRFARGFVARRTKEKRAEASALERRLAKAEAVRRREREAEEAELRKAEAEARRQAWQQGIAGVGDAVSSRIQWVLGSMGGGSTPDDDEEAAIEAFYARGGGRDADDTALPPMSPGRINLRPTAEVEAAAAAPAPAAGARRSLFGAVNLRPTAEIERLPLRARARPRRRPQSRRAAARPSR